MGADVGQDGGEVRQRALGAIPGALIPEGGQGGGGQDGVEADGHDVGAAGGAQGGEAVGRAGAVGPDEVGVCTAWVRVREKLG